MVRLFQRSITIKLNGETEERELLHIFSENGYFKKGPLKLSHHIQLGEHDSVENYEEVIDGRQNKIPESLPPIITEEVEEEKEEEKET